MSTKIKGEAIKEGSIPLSALSSEAQEKIENSGSKVFVFTYDMIKSENEDGSLTIDPANAIEMINSDFINMMDIYNMEKTYTYGDFAVFSFTLRFDPLTSSQVIIMYVNSEGVIETMSAGEEHPFVYDSDSKENENKVRKRLSLLDLALGDSDRKDYTEYIDEVKENVKKNLDITDAVTPDWNAQKGEAGYIENRTHGITWYSKPEDVNFNDLLLVLKNKTPEIIIEDSFTKATYKQVNELDSMAVYGFKFFEKTGAYDDNYLDRFTDTFLTYDGTDGSIYVDYDDNGDVYVTIQWDNSTGLEDVNDILDGINQDYYVIDVSNFEISTLDSAYLPNTVLKTTPQTLHTHDKKQALTNLGIDPVVWKYITDPCWIIPGSPIPEDLANIIYDYEAGIFNSIIKNVCVFNTTTEEGDCFKYIFYINLNDDVVYTMDNTKTIFKYKYNRTSRTFTEYQ